MSGVDPTTRVSLALVDALLADAAALDQLAAALAPRLATVSTNGDIGPGLTTQQAAERAGVHDRTVRRALAAGTLAGRTVAGRWRVDSDDLAAWLQGGAPTSSAPTPTNGRAIRSACAGADAIAGAGGRSTRSTRSTRTGAA